MRDEKNIGSGIGPFAEQVKDDVSVFLIKRTGGLVQMSTVGHAGPPEVKPIAVVAHH